MSMVRVETVSKEEDPMSRNPISNFILDRLAAGDSFKDLQSVYGFSRKDLVAAAVNGVEELHPQYVDLLLKHLKLK